MSVASLPDQSVDLVLTSPPFLALRSYLPADHPDKGKEIGSEATPGDFIDTLLDVTEACARVLTPHGSICIELGDTYSGSGGAGGDYNADGLREGQAKFSGSAAKRRSNGLTENDRPARVGRSGWHRDGAAVGERAGQRYRQTGYEADSGSPNGGHGWPLAKSLCLIPESYRWALVYGRNPFNGRETPPWRARNVVRWCRPNPPVGALGDKFRPGTSDMVVACKSGSRYFDLDAVRTPSDYDRPNLQGQGSRGPGELVPGQKRNGSDYTVNAGGAPPLDWWNIPTEPYAGSHYACWPTALLTRPIESMCPRSVCQTCGKPSERIVDVQHEPNRNTNGPQSIERKHLDGGSAGYAVRADRRSTTTGWTDCGHNDWRNGLVLDPFAGSGTTLAVATGHSRDAIGIDIDSRNADLARERVGMFLTVEHFAGEVAP